jgi:protein-S-isoprenylcysteine O-methyltransferase
MTSEDVYRIAFFLLLFALLAMRIFFMIRLRRSGGPIMPDKSAIAHEGGRGLFVFRVVMFLALIVFLVMYFLGAKWIDAFLFPLPDWWRWVGFAVGVISIVFWTWTQVTLDTQWSAQLQLRKNHHLITTGPYVRIRHLMYAGLMLAAWGSLLIYATWTTVYLAVFAPALLLRARREEQALAAEFAEQWQDYCKRVPAFFPRLK